LTTLEFVQDFAPGTSDATPPSGPPPLTGARSGYGSLQLNGTFTTLVIGTGTNTGTTDLGSFTLSVAVPEPGSMVLAGLTGLALAAAWRRARLKARAALGLAGPADPDDLDAPPGGA
jgi:hypothetical protein